jgi:DNA-dependent RNA polymerase auxiliary subunit epsilon
MSENRSSLSLLLSFLLLFLNGIAGILFIAFYQRIQDIAPLREKNRQLEKEIREEEEKMRQKDQLSQNLHLLQQKYKQNSYKAVLPLDKESLEEAIVDLRHFSDKLEIPPFAFKTQGIKPEALKISYLQPLIGLETSFQFTASFDQCGAFLRRIDQLLPLLFIKDLEISSDSVPSKGSKKKDSLKNNLNVKMVLESFYYGNPEADFVIPGVNLQERIARDLLAPWETQQYRNPFKNLLEREE